MRRFLAGEYRGQDLSLFHDGLAAQFRTDRFDDELETIQSEVEQVFPDTADRDPLFTRLVDAHMERAFLKDSLGGLYGAYETAYEAMKATQLAYKYPYFGVIHFDPSHKDGTIFDYMANAPRMKAINYDKGRLIREIGNKVFYAHQALEIRAQLALLDTHAVLPPELEPYNTLVMPGADETQISEQDREFASFDIDVSALDIDSFYSLTLAEIVEVRKAGAAYFAALENMRLGVVSFDEILKSLKDYTSVISMFGYRHQKRPSTVMAVRQKASVLVGRVTDLASRGGLAAVLQIGGHFVFAKFYAVFSPALLALARSAESAMKTAAEKRRNAYETERAAIRAEFVIDKESNYLTQYKK
jgi:hypothetical protein